MSDGKRNDYSAYFPEGKGKKWRKKAWSMNGGQKKRKKNWGIIITIAISLLTVVAIMFEIISLEFLNAILEKANKRGTGRLLMEYFTAESLNKLLEYGREYSLALAAVGIAVFQVAESNYEEDRKRAFGKKACSYAIFMIAIMLVYYFLFIFTEYHSKNPNEEIENLIHILSVGLIVIIPMLLLYVLFIFVELFEVKIPKWLKVIAIAIAGIGVLIVESIVLFF